MREYFKGFRSTPTTPQKSASLIGTPISSPSSTWYNEALEVDGSQNVSGIKYLGYDGFSIANFYSTGRNFRRTNEKINQLEQILPPRSDNYKITNIFMLFTLHENKDEQRQIYILKAENKDYNEHAPVKEKEEKEQESHWHFYFEFKENIVSQYENDFFSLKDTENKTELSISTLTKCNGRYIKVQEPFSMKLDVLIS